MECIKTNVFAAENVINAALDTGVKRVVALSTDKAAAPINLYGATKLCSDKLFVAANNMRGSRDLRFSVVRYGNVIGSRGSVVPFFLEKRKEGVLPITDVSDDIGPECEQKSVGIRPGEKLHEEMITETDSLNTIETAKYFVITPAASLSWTMDEYMKAFDGKMVDMGFKYNSGTNTDWLNVEQLREQIREHVDPSFNG